MKEIKSYMSHTMPLSCVIGGFALILFSDLHTATTTAYQQQRSMARLPHSVPGNSCLLFYDYCYDPHIDHQIMGILSVVFFTSHFVSSSRKTSNDHSHRPRNYAWGEAGYLHRNKIQISTTTGDKHELCQDRSAREFQMGSALFCSASVSNKFAFISHEINKWNHQIYVFSSTYYISEPPRARETEEIQFRFFYAFHLINCHRVWLFSGESIFTIFSSSSSPSLWMVVNFNYLSFYSDWSFHRALVYTRHLHEVALHLLLILSCSGVLVKSPFGKR